MRSFDVVRASIASIHSTLRDVAPDHAEVARLDMLLKTDELWGSCSPSRAPGSSGEHQISIRYRPSKFSALRNPTSQATAICLAVTTLAQLAFSHFGGSAPPPPAPTYLDAEESE
jgi:hypothetical protein